MEPFIKLDRTICEYNRLTFEFSTNLDLFTQNTLFIEYSKPLTRTVDSINTIPFAAIMAPIAWATGAELIIPSLDETYAHSLERCSQFFKTWFSGKWPFSTPLKTTYAKNLFAPNGHAMLFSGGLDSLATYLSNKEKELQLFTVFGADIPLSHDKFIQLCREKFDEFSERENAAITYIYTNVRDVLRLDLLKKYANNWYGEVAHGMTLSSMIAPISYHSVKTLFMASCSHRAGSCYACGSEKELVDQIQWAGTGVENDNHDLDRVGKIREFLKPNPTYMPYLRVCWMQFKSLNCGKCEKCLRTICELLLNNVDPKHCNFKIDEKTLPALRWKMQTQYYLFFRGESALDFWRTIQENINLDHIQDLYGSREFFRWFAGLGKIKEKQNPLLLKAGSWLLNARIAVGKPLRPLKALVAS